MYLWCQCWLKDKQSTSYCYRHQVAMCVTVSCIKMIQTHISPQNLKNTYDTCIYSTFENVSDKSLRIILNKILSDARRDKNFGFLCHFKHSSSRSDWFDKVMAQFKCDFQHVNLCHTRCASFNVILIRLKIFIHINILH